MFTDLLSWFSNTWTTFLGILQSIWDFGKASWFWVIGLVFAFLSISERVTLFVWDSLLSIVDMLASFALSDHELADTVVGESLVIANTFFPVAEGFTLLTALSSVMLVVITYRFFKSWMPSVN